MGSDPKTCVLELRQLCYLDAAHAALSAARKAGGLCRYRHKYEEVDSDRRDLMDQDHNKAPGVWRARLALTSRRLLEGRAGDALMLTAIRMLYEERLRRIALGASRALLHFIVKAAPEAGGRADPERLAFARAILDTCGTGVKPSPWISVSQLYLPPRAEKARIQDDSRFIAGGTPARGCKFWGQTPKLAFLS